MRGEIMTGRQDTTSLYWETVIRGLNLDDVRLLGVLKDQDATDRFKAMQGDNLLKASSLTEANYRKALARMEAAMFVERVPGVRPYTVFLTSFGANAVAQAMAKIA